MRIALSFGTSLALCLTLAACNGDSSTDPDNGPAPGAFTATITGDIDTQLEGTAFFGEATDPDTQESGWVLWLTTTESQAAGRAVYFVRQGTRPGTGTHSLLDLDGGDDLESGGIAGVFYDYSSQSAVAALTSTGGTLQITESGSGGMEGSFTFEATGVVFDGSQASEATVTVTGSFDADGGNVFYPGL